MLDSIGVATVEDLFASIPARLKVHGDLKLPPSHSELDLRRMMGAMAARNASAATHAFFLGAGAYNHYIPSVVWQLLLRSEFYTSYTPYQPEISQGTLQATFEFQSLIALLTGMEIANASLYDGASATAEAALLAHRQTKRRRLLFSSAVHPLYRQVTASYVQNLGLEMVTIPYGKDGRTDLDALAREAAREGDAAPAIVALQNPNFFGCVEALGKAGSIARDRGALLAVAVAEPVSLGLIRPPGDWGADIVVGEGHALGAPLSFGGPFLGFMAAKESLLRQMPGRLVGEAMDASLRRGYVLTLSTREQHIRREKATSNICTNQGLIATAATIHMSLMGKEGMREAAIQCHSKAQFARDCLAKVRGCRLRFDASIFNEFVLDLPAPASRVVNALVAKGVIAGLDLARFYQEMPNALLVCVTEMNSREEIEWFAAKLDEVLR